MAFWIVHFLGLSLVLSVEGQINCKYETAIANCFCSKEVDIIQKVRIIEIQSESCNCTINFIGAQDPEQPPTIVHVFDKLCKWHCNEKECVPDNILQEVELEGGKTTGGTRKQEIATTTPQPSTLTTNYVPDNSLQDIELEGGKTTGGTSKQEIATTPPQPSTLTTNYVLDKTMTHNYGDKMANTMETAMTAFWAGCGIFGMFALMSLLKSILQLKRNNMYLPLHQPLDTTTITADRHQISQTQTSFLSMISSEQPTLPPSITPPPTSTPDYSVDRLPVFTFETETTPTEQTIPLPSFRKDSSPEPPTTCFDNRDSSPEPSAPLMEMEELNEPVATRTRNKKKQLEAAL